MMRTITRRALLAILAASGFAFPEAASTQQQTALKVTVFPGISNLPLFAAQAQGSFRKRGLDVEIVNTRSSEELRTGLGDGRFQIAHAGVDNAVAMAEFSRIDIAVFIGGHGGFGQLIVQPDISALRDLRGRTVVVDAPNTAYALVLHKILQDHGLKRGDYNVNSAGGTASMVDALLKDKANAAAIVSPPFSFRAERGGMKNLGAVKAAIGEPYQFDAGFALRSFARQHAEVMVRYIQAYVEGSRWALNSANQAAATALLAERLQLAPAEAASIYEIISDPFEGIARDAKLDPDGFATTLRLRASIEGQWSGTPPPASKYVDESYYTRALGGL